MKCYYEELDVARDANDADIKSAYRKLALRWHPDKNPDCLEEAKQRFQLIQQAYEVLSDAHERAWYDNHREQILHGKNSNYSDNCLDVFKYFTVSCYKGYGDDAQGFYAVYREVFAKIAVEDAEFFDDEDELLDIPKFGDSQSSYEEVVGPFYAYWQAYCTKKPYTWLCPYDVQEIRDRRVLREIEKDLKKVVQKAKRERNEEVRNLVSFVRKRDKRVQANKRLLEERAAHNRMKQEQNRLEQFRKRQQELKNVRENSSQQHNNEKYEELLNQLEQEYRGDSSTEDNDSGEGEDDDNVDESAGAYIEHLNDLYCVACNKTFRNENAFANHETSKKHREKVELLKLEMQKDDEMYRETVTDEEIAASDLEDIDRELSDEVELEDECTENEVESEMGPAIVNQIKKGKKAKKGNKGSTWHPLTSTALSDDEETAMHDFIAQAKAEENSDAENWNSGTKKSARKSKTKNKQNKKSTEPTGNSEIVKEQILSQPEAASALANTAQENIDNTTPIHSCATCRAVFPSKNKLFAHLKLTNHVVYIPKAKAVTVVAAENGKQKKSKSKRK